MGKCTSCPYCYLFVIFLRQLGRHTLFNLQGIRTLGNRFKFISFFFYHHGSCCFPENELSPDGPNLWRTLGTTRWPVP